MRARRLRTYTVPPNKRRRIPLSTFGSLHVLGDASPMPASAVEATKESTIMARDELLCHIPMMAEVEPEALTCCARDSVGLEHLPHGHIDFDRACSNCNMMQIRHSQHRRQLDSLFWTTQWRPRSLCLRRWMVRSTSPFPSRETQERGLL